MQFGLSKNIIERIRKTFEANAKVDDVIIFGSRAKGNYKEGSDIDLAVKGRNIKLDDILKLNGKLDELNLPYKIDLIDYATIQDKDVVEHIDRMGIIFYERWKKKKLGDFIEVVNGYAFKSSNFLDSGITDALPVIKIKNVANGDVHLNDVQYHSYDNSLKKFVVEKDDLLIALTGNHPEVMTQVVGDVSRYKLNKKALLNQRVAKIIAKENLNKDFLYYFLKDNSTRHYLASQSAGSANQANISKTDIENIPVLLPPLEEQNVIASTLSSLDDKIDLLHRQNKTLEQLAETLFRKWFVEDTDVSWEVIKLGDVAVVQNGYAFSSREYVPFQNNYLEVLKMGHIEPGGGLRTNPKKDFVPREDKLKKWTLKKNDIVMAMTDMKDNVVILGVPAIIDKSDKYVLNQRVARIYLESYEKLINSYLLYIQLNNSEFIATLQNKANSGVQVNLSTEAIKDCDIIIPPIELQKEKGQSITELYLKKENNNNQIKTLSQLRDTLLPKLMSGEVRVEMN